MTMKMTDIQRAYPDNQDKWQAFSEETLKEFSEKITEFSSFKDAFDFLAKKRAEIAETLKQRKEDNSDEGHYGVWRGDIGYETVDLQSDKPPEERVGPWVGQAQSIHDAVKRLMPESQVKEKDFDYYEYTSEKLTLDEVLKIKKDLVEEDEIEELAELEALERSGEIWKMGGETIRIKNHQRGEQKVGDENCSTRLSEITLEGNVVSLVYNRPNKYDRKGDLILADRYYQELLSWSDKHPEDRNGFLKAAGRLSHLLAHLLLVERGNASIIEWMVQGLANKNNIELGDFRKDNDLSWDWKALLTPNPEDYANWYMQNAFQPQAKQDLGENLKGADVSYAAEPAAQAGSRDEQLPMAERISRSGGTILNALSKDAASANADAGSTPEKPKVAPDVVKDPSERRQSFKKD